MVHSKKMLRVCRNESRRGVKEKIWVGLEERGLK